MLIMMDELLFFLWHLTVAARSLRAPTTSIAAWFSPAGVFHPSFSPGIYLFYFTSSAPHFMLIMMDYLLRLHRLLTEAFRCLLAPPTSTRYAWFLPQQVGNPSFSPGILLFYFIARYVLPLGTTHQATTSIFSFSGFFSTPLPRLLGTSFPRPPPMFLSSWSNLRSRFLIPLPTLWFNYLTAPCRAYTFFPSPPLPRSPFVVTPYFSQLPDCFTTFPPPFVFVPPYEGFFGFCR